MTANGLLSGSLEVPNSLWVAVAACVIAGSACSALDGALRALGEARIRAAREGVGRSASAAGHYLADSRRVHAQLLAGRIVYLAGASTLAVYLGGQIAGILGGVIATGVVSLSYGVLAEAATRFASRRATRFALPLLSALRLVMWLHTPFSLPLRIVGNAVDRFFPPSPEDDPERITEADVEQMIDQGEEIGSITQDHAEMLRAVLDFHAMLAREIMVPRTRMVAVEISTPIDQVIELIIDSGHSRYPVYREKADVVIGVLYAKDLFRAVRERGRDIRLGEVVRKDVFFVAETHKIGALLNEMQARHVHLAIVTDEFGGTAGIITLEDILEEIVGDIQDEHDREEPEVRVLGAGRFEADASVSLHHFEEVVGVTLERAEAASDSLGGLIVETAGRVPAPGERIQIGDIAFTVLDSDARRIQRVGVERPTDLASAAG